MPPAFSCALIVDDDPIQLELLDSSLRARGVVTVLKANDGKSAKVMLAQHGAEIDLITTDLNMPDFDGVEFLMHLDSVKFGGKLAIISGAVPTVAAAAAKLAAVYGIGYIGFLKKPVTPAGLDGLLSGKHR